MSSPSWSGSQLAELPHLAAIRGEKARRSLAAFVEQTAPWTLEDWQQLICARLQRLMGETGQRLLIHGPPQFGKSLIISQRFPCWGLGTDPLHRFRLACYNLTHASRFGRVNLDLMRSPEFLAAFPDDACRVPPVCAAEQWSTAARAAQRDAQPSFVALGLGSGFTGLGVDTLIVDDPYKNREEAYSEVINAGIWDWWTDVVIPRLNPATNVVVMFHRWKEDDLAGRLLEQGGWESMRFPALGDGEPDDPTGRAEGAPLSPRYSAEYLAEVKRTQGPTSFVALFQGRPAPKEGNLFKAHWFHRAPAVPAEAERVRAWDLAATDGGGDWTCGMKMAKDAAGIFWLEDVVRGQWGPGERDEVILSTARRDGSEVSVWIEEEAGSAGKAQSLALVRKLAGFAVRAERPTGDKEIRALPLAAQMEVGNVRFLKAPWYEALESEMLAFPTGKHDDQIDAAALAFAKLAESATLVIY